MTNDVIAAAWEKVTEDWQNQSRHDALMALATEHQAFKWVATKYRERKGDAIADAQLAKIAAAAMATLTIASAAKRGSKEASANRRALIWLAVFLMMLAFGLLAAKLVTAAHHAPRP